MAEINGSGMYACAGIAVSNLARKMPIAYLHIAALLVHIVLSVYPDILKFTACILSGAVILKHLMHKSRSQRNKYSFTNQQYYLLRCDAVHNVCLLLTCLLTGLILRT
jgi:hypothetical protein